MNQQLVKTLLVEIDASTEKLRRALREGGVELDTFAQKSTQASATSSTAASTVATQHANAARQIAMVTETVARQGQVSGESAKQLIAQASSMAFAFGPQGIIVGAIGVATLAIGTMFARTRREMQETMDKAREAANQFSEMDAVGQARAINQLVTGRRSDDAVLSTEEILARPEDQRAELFRERGINRLRQDAERLARTVQQEAAQAEEWQRVSGAVAGDFGVAAESDAARQLKAVQAALALLNDEYERNTNELKQNAAAEAARNQDGARRQAQEDAKAKAKEKKEQARAQAERERVQFEQRLSQISDAAQEKRYSEFQARLKDGFSGTRAEVERAFAEAVAFAEEHGEQAEIPILVNARDRALELIDALEQSEQLLASIGAREFGERVAKSDAVALTGPAAGEAAALRAQRERWRAIAADTSRSEAERQAALKQAIQLQGVLEGLVEKEVGARARATDALIAQAQLVGQAVDGVLQLMGAWGGVRREVVDVLRGLMQMASNVPSLIKQLDRLKDARAGTLRDDAGNLISVGAAAAGVAGAAIPIIGALSTIGQSLFGDSPAERERKRVQQANTAAIERLTQVMSLGINVSGQDFAAAAREVDALLGRNAGDPGDSRWGVVRDAPGGQRLRRDWLDGIDMELLNRVAKELGVALNGTVGSMRQFEEALAAAREKLYEFDDSFRDETVVNEAIINAKGITDPLDRFLARLGPAMEASPLIRQLVGSADLSTDAGRQAVLDQVVAILETMRAGGDSIGADLGGDLTRDELLEVLQQVIQGVTDLGESARPVGSNLGGISGFRGLTEAAGERMADYLRGILGQGGEHLQVLRAQLAELTRIASTPFTLPAIPGVTVPMPASPGGTTFTVGAINIGDIVVQVSGSTTDPAGLGLQVTQAVRDLVEELLYRSLAKALRVRGDVSVIPGVR